MVEREPVRQERGDACVAKLAGAAVGDGLVRGAVNLEQRQRLLRLAPRLDAVEAGDERDSREPVAQFAAEQGDEPAPVRSAGRVLAGAIDAQLALELVEQLAAERYVLVLDARPVADVPPASARVRVGADASELA